MDTITLWVVCAEFVCPDCNKLVQVTELCRDKPVHCTGCGHKFVVGSIKVSLDDY